jgi:hypothetical protein
LAAYINADLLLGGRGVLLKQLTALDKAEVTIDFLLECQEMFVGVIPLQVIEYRKHNLALGF